jgi:Zn ribbon nucleic-acid-binding protein
MNAPALKVSSYVGGEPTAWKCPACSEPFHLAPYEGTETEKVDQMKAAYAKHFKDRHSREDFSQAAARIVREATENH